MPIVLAIEPDRRQAAHLTAIVRNQVGAELVIADTTEAALDAIGNRVPDLVLVPALLSPQDDAALAAALRVIAAAARVRTLTIPVLANGTKRKPAGGMLAKWRKSRAASPEPDGCDPAVFGEQISTYLQEAAAERAELEDVILGNAPLAAAPPTPTLEREDTTSSDYEPIAARRSILNLETEFRYQPPTLHTDSDIPPAASIEHAQAAEAEPVQLLADYPVEAPRIDPNGEPLIGVDAQPLIEADAVPQIAADAVPLLEPDAAPLIEVDAEPLIDLSDQLAALSDGSEGGLSDGEAVGVYTLSVEADAPEFVESDTTGIEAFDLLPAILEPSLIAEDVEAALDLIAAEAKAGSKVARLEPASMEPARVEAVARPRLVQPPEAPRADIASWTPMYLTPGRIWPALEGMPAETPAARTEQPDWIELVASLRQDLERRRTDHAAAAPRVAARPFAARPLAARPSDGANASANRLVKRPRPYLRPAAAKPVQDEWGFFDPEQCGFSTLLAKLEEITEEA
jgi:hypothetical protein